MQPKALSKPGLRHQLVVAEASEARKAYLQQVLDSLQYLREHGLAGTAKQAVSAIVSRVDEAQQLPPDRESEALPLIRNVQEAWSKLASSPPGEVQPHFASDKGKQVLASALVHLVPSSCFLRAQRRKGLPLIERALPHGSMTS